MRQILPTAADGLDLVALYAADERPAHADRPWLFCNMVASVDGGTAIGDLSGPLGGPADKEIFAAIRATADVILVGSATVRAERYGPPRSTEPVKELRRGRGQQPTPRLAVLSGRLDIDLDSPVFAEADPGARPIVVTAEQSPTDEREAIAELADVVVAGDRYVDIPAALGQLRSSGAHVVLAEGGPGLNGHLLAAGVVDELCLTLSPLLAGGDSRRIVHNSANVDPQPLHLERVLEDGGYLFLRYVRA